MDSILVIFLSGFILMNFLAFFIMLIDKGRARQTGAERVSEGTLFFLATCFGSLGVYLGMFLFRHKTRQWHFLIGIPLLFVQNLCMLYVLYVLLVSGFSLELL